MKDSNVEKIQIDYHLNNQILIIIVIKNVKHNLILIFVQIMMIVIY